MAALLDGVVLNCAITGTLPLTLGSAVAPYLSMSQAGAVSGNTYSYSIIDANPVGGGNSEYGTGVWTSGGVNGTLTRNPIWSTNANGLINCSGSELVRITALMEDLIPSAQLGPEFVMLNGKLVVSVAGNNLTIAVKTRAGNDPSAGDPVFFVFRNATAATGDYTVIKVAVALNFTINSGNNLGTANGVPFRIWVVALNNGGTVVLGVQNCVVGAASPTQVGPLAEDALQTTSPNSNGGNAAATLYCSAGLLSNVPMRILGYMEWSSGLATAGTWSSGPTKIQLFGPGVKKPGDSVQRVYLLTSNRKVTTSNIVVDTFVTQNFTPQGAPNVVQIRLNSSIGVQANGHQAFWWLLRATGSAPVQNRVFIGGSAITDLETAITQELWDAPSGTSQVTYKVVIRNDDNATVIAVPSSSGDTATLVIEEIMA